MLTARCGLEGRGSGIESRMSSLWSMGGAAPNPPPERRRHPTRQEDTLKGSQKPKKLQKKVAQKTLKERRLAKKAAGAEQDRAARTRA